MAARSKTDRARLISDVSQTRILESNATETAGNDKAGFTAAQQQGATKPKGDASRRFVCGLVGRCSAARVSTSAESSVRGDLLAILVSSPSLYPPTSSSSTYLAQRLQFRNHHIFAAGHATILSFSSVCCLFAVHDGHVPTASAEHVIFAAACKRPGVPNFMCV